MNIIRRMMRQLGGQVRVRLIACFLLPIILLIALGIVSYINLSTTITGNYAKSGLLSLNMTKDYLALKLDIIKDKAVQLDLNSTVTDYYTGIYKDDLATDNSYAKDVAQLIAATTSSDKYIYNVAILSEYGQSMSYFGDLDSDVYDNYLKSQEYALWEGAGGTNIWIGEHKYIDENITQGMKKSTSKGEYCLSVIRKLSDRYGSAAGSIIIDVKADLVQELFDKIGADDGSIAGMITSDKREITKDNSEISIVNQPFYTAVKDGDSGYEYVNYGNDRYLFIYSRLEDANILLYSMVPEHIITSQADKLKLITLGFVFLSSIIAILLGSYMAQGMGNAINKANKVLKQASTGDLTVTLDIRRRDEFHTLSEGINNTLSEMKKIIRNVNTISNMVSLLGQKVAKNSGLLLEGTKCITETVNEIESGISQEAEDTEKCYLQMSELATQINRLNENTKEIELITSESKEYIDKGMLYVDDLQEKAKETSETTRAIIEDIEMLEDESKAVNSILSTINEIAQQTNLLSLNASIEAARAGDAGKGFAVVAAEIRKLAEEASDASSRIAGIIKAIQDRTGKTVVAAKHASSTVEAQEIALQKTVAVFEDINSRFTKLILNFEKNAEEIKKIESAKDITLGAMESISAFAEETSAAASVLINSSRVQLAAVEELNQDAAELGLDSGRLKELVNVFSIK